MRALAAYQRLALEPGEARDVALYVDARRLSIWCRHPPLGAQRRPARRGGRLLLA
ncbi:fibronectin type III-like domain-contianing protein [Streptomyces sviceus]|uniref:fibronectin type III-like domain-contianing protein n=1 Tax=Streptomyces sviceus TaxID=285530 RepID=UPI003679C498